jgi:hypothetical protein
MEDVTLQFNYCMHNSHLYVLNIFVYMGAIPKSASVWLVKKIQNREQSFIIWNSYIHNCITLLYGTVTYITALLYYMEQLHI